MAAAVAGPLLATSADIGALVGLGQHIQPTREEVFAPYCGKWLKVRASKQHQVCIETACWLELLPAKVRHLCSQRCGWAGKVGAVVDKSTS